MNWIARERPAEHAGGRLDRQRLREAGNAFDQEMALREQADEDALEHRVLAGDHAPDLEQRLLQAVFRLGGSERGTVVRHLEASLVNSPLVIVEGR